MRDSMREEVSFHMLLKKMTPNYVEKEELRVIMSHYPVELVSKIEEY